jgi:hypothetical protein
VIAGQAGAYRPLLYIAVAESDLLEGMGEHERSAQVARAGIAQAQVHGLARFSGALLAANLAESLLSPGRWDEAAEVIDHTLEMAPPRGTRAVLSHLAGELALARGATRRRSRRHAQRPAEADRKPTRPCGAPGQRTML